MEQNGLNLNNPDKNDALPVDRDILNDLKNINQDNISSPKTLLKLADNVLDNCIKEFTNGKAINLNNIKEMIPKDKLKDNFSKAIDGALEVAKNTNLLPSFLCNTLKATKDYFMQDKIDKKIDKYINSLEKSATLVQKDISNWQKAYNCGDLNGMQKALDSTRKHISKLIPIDNLKENFNNILYTHKYNNAQKDLNSNDKSIVEKAVETIKLCEKLGSMMKK